MTNADLEELFSQAGSVTSANIIMDRDTGRSRGFGFVEMPDESGNEAIASLNGRDCLGRSLVINEARPMKRDDRGGGGGGGGRGGRGGRGGGGGGGRQRW